MEYKEIKQTLSMISDPVEKLEMVMELGNTLKVPPQDAVCKEIVGCVSFVQICEKNGIFYGKADSGIVRGILAIFLSIIDKKTKTEIINIDLQTEFKNLHLDLGTNRLNGIQSIINFFHNL